MEQRFVARFMKAKPALRSQWAEGPPSDYKTLVRHIVERLGDGECDDPDPERVHQVDDGDYQGTLVFVIGATGYQPSNYWSVLVSYGSCSGCDTLQRLLDYGETMTEERLDGLMTLALHVVQKIKPMGDAL